MKVSNDLDAWYLPSIFLRPSRIVGATCLILSALAPAQAQFWSPFAPAPQQQQRQQPWQFYNPFGGFFPPQAARPQEPQRRRSHVGNGSEMPTDYSHAPASPQHKKGVAPTTSIVVMGDAMADWLGYGLEDAFMDAAEIQIVRKNRTGSGLIRYDSRHDVDWAQAAREIIRAEKPKIIVMMVGINDHQSIRERPQAPKPAAGAPATGKAGTPTGRAAEKEHADGAQNPGPEIPDHPALGQEAGHSNRETGPFEFHTDQWEAAYIKRIDATIAALKGGGVPVLWVGLPAQLSPTATSDASYLNELYRRRAEKAGITYVDVWDGFVDEQGRYSARGPDVEGQVRRLRSGDGVYFTDAGARKLAHYAARDIGFIINHVNPTALPAAINPARPDSSSEHPLVGPVLPLTVPVGKGSDELLGSALRSAKPVIADSLATQVFIKGGALEAPAGRADDFTWPRDAATLVNAEPSEPERMAAPPNAKTHHAGRSKGRYTETSR
jgi:hypothetical protein